MDKKEQIVSRIIENAIEIAEGNLPKLQDYFAETMGRGSIIENYIVPWAHEAENQWGKFSMYTEEIDYYDYIDKFASQKMEELLCQDNCGIETR